MHALAALAALAALVAAMFFDLLFFGGGRVVGAENTDIGLHFLHWRSFGFAELARGNVALWNPHIYAGVPFFGGMQSAMLYPLNWIHLVLPAPAAVNWSVALNTWLLGAFTYLWAARRGLRPIAAFLAAALAMFCAPHFLRAYAGHITMMAAIAWVPLVFLAIDAWLESRRPVWILVGTAAVAMQVLAGHPQTVYLSALMAGLYSLLRRDVLGVMAMYVGGAALAAVQLVGGMQATAETVRDRPMSFEMARYFGFPLENLVTLVAPGFFGDGLHHPYWGRWYIWEGSLFIGVAGLALSVYGIARGELRHKTALLASAGAAALVALGDATPLFGLLFDWLPWFDRFRGAAKFIVVTALILVLFAGAGLDKLLGERTAPRAAAWAAGLAALALGAASLAVREAGWGQVVAAVLMSGDSYLEHARYTERGFLFAARSFAALGLAASALTLALVAGLLLWTRREPRAAVLLGILAVIEVFAFARLNRPSFDSAQIVIPPLARFLESEPGDYRILNLARPNSAMSMRAFDAWGYDPGLTRRYAEFIYWSVGADPGKTIPYVTFERFHPLLSMVRVKYVVQIENGLMTIHPGGRAPLPRLELVGDYRVLPTRDEVLGAMGAASFDPAREAILQSEPVPRPAGGKPLGRARILREGSDFMEVEAELDRAALLVVTDAWTPSWRAVALDPGDPRRYAVVPANYVLRAVALDKGRHRLRLEYSPTPFRIGLAVSAVAWAAWLAGLWLALRRRGVNA